MLFGPVDHTDYDLRFRTLGFPTRVHPAFWLVSVLMSWEVTQIDPMLLVVWIAALFLSILIHELGHALAFRRFGSPSEIVLHGFGGLAIPPPYARFGTWEWVIISFAGPAAGFMLLVPVLALQWAAFGTAAIGEPVIVYSPDYTVGHFYLLSFLRDMVWINLWWGLVNLLPVMPLDGGKISQSLFERYARIRGTEYSLKLSILVAVVVAVWAINRERRYVALMFGILAIMNGQRLQGLGRGGW